MTEFTFRFLSIQDTVAFRQLRLFGLQESPRSFLEDYEETKDKPLPYFEKFFKNGWITGAFSGETLVAIAGLYIHKGMKLRHKGTVWGVYTLPEHRKNGLANRVITMLLKEATACGLERVTLSVDEASPAALATYTKLGFTEYGREPHFMKIGDAYVTEILMMLDLKGLQ